MAVIVVVRLDDVESAEFTCESGLAGAVAKCAIAVVVEEAELVERPGRRNHDVEQAVAIKVIYDDAAGVLPDAEIGLRCDVRKLADVVFRSKAALWYQRAAL